MPGVDRVTAGQYLPVNQSITSLTKQYSATVLCDGNVVVRRNLNNDVLGSSNTAPNNNVTKLAIGYDCKVAINGSNPAIPWSAGRSDEETESVLIIGNDGNLSSLTEHD